MVTLAGGAAGCDAGADKAAGEIFAACVGAVFEASRLEIKLSG